MGAQLCHFLLCDLGQALRRVIASVSLSHRVVGTAPTSEGALLPRDISEQGRHSSAWLTPPSPQAEPSQGAVGSRVDCWLGKGVWWQNCLPTNPQWCRETLRKLEEAFVTFKSLNKVHRYYKCSQGRWKRHVTVGSGFLKLDQESWYAFPEPILWAFSQGIKYGNGRRVFPFGE